MTAVAGCLSEYLPARQTGRELATKPTVYMSARSLRHMLAGAAESVASPSSPGRGK